MPTVHEPSRNKAMVSLVARPQRRCTAMEIAVPNGRAMKASEKIAKEASVPSSLENEGNSNAGKTNTQAMPNTKKSKYSDDRPITTPTAISPGVTSSSVSARDSASGLSKPPAGNAV
ncbi:hypothetical protein D3C80_1565570 [compost metagenome]